MDNNSNVNNDNDRRLFYPCCACARGNKSRGARGHGNGKDVGDPVLEVF